MMADMQYKNLVVALNLNEDPKVYTEGGQDVSEYCSSITIFPGRRAEASMNNHDSKGRIYKDNTNPKDPVLAGYTTNVININGTWIAMGED